MVNPITGIPSVLGRVMIGVIFLMSALANKIPQFNQVTGMMKSEGVPLPSLMLVGAIVFLIAGSISIMAGYYGRIGATLLLVFLVLVTYYFHDFWNMEGDLRQAEMGNFIKNMALMGTMVFIIANGTGSMSLDNRPKRRRR